jgi:hypothetical protein
MSMPSVMSTDLYQHGARLSARSPAAGDTVAAADFS